MSISNEALTKNVPILTREGFTEWKMQVNALLRVLKLQGIISGELKRPVKPEKLQGVNRTLKKSQRKKILKAYRDKVKTFKEKRDRVWLILVTACGKSWQSLISRFEEKCAVRSAWKAILENFGHGSSQLNANQTEKLFSGLSMKRSVGLDADLLMDFTTFAAQVDSVANRLSLLNGSAVADSRKIFVLTEGLPVEFSEFTNNLISIRENLTYVQAVDAISSSIKRNKSMFDVVPTVSSEDTTKTSKKRVAHSSGDEEAEPVSSLDLMANVAQSMALHVKNFGKLVNKSNAGANKEKRRHIQCFNCKGYGHISDQCPSERSNKESEETAGGEDEDGAARKANNKKFRGGGHAGAAVSQSDLDLLNANGAVLDAFMADDRL